MFNWFKKRRRRKILREPWQDEWTEILRKNFRQYRVFEQLIQSGNLQEQVLLKLHNITKILVAEKSWVGSDGFEITDEAKVTIAAQVALMLLGVDNFYFENVSTVVVSADRLNRQYFDGTVVHEDQNFAGMAWRDGYVLLSWFDVLGGARSSNDAYNVVIHEFAHCLDNLDGAMAGDLIFPDDKTDKRWNDVIDLEFNRLRKAKESGRYTLLDDYGGTNKAEFFAVASETFFERPERLKTTHTELYSLLVLYYRIDPIDWKINL